MISKIHVPRQTSEGLENGWVWQGNREGIYTIATGYSWLVSHQRTWTNDYDWKWIWRVGAPAKVQFLLWLISHESLPTNALHHKRGLADSPRCFRCSADTEDINHCLRDCPHSHEVWLQVGMQYTNNFFSKDISSSWLKEHSSGEKGSGFLATLWWIWCWRNQAIMGEEVWDLHFVLRKIKLSYEDYTIFLNANPDVVTRKLFSRWTPPPQGTTKINVDGGFNHATFIMSTGGLIRYHAGTWTKGFSTIEGQGDCLLAELLAVANGLQFAWDEGLRDILCETDSKEVVSLLHKDTPYDLHEHAAIIHAIRLYCDRDWRVTISHVFRDCNHCADHLARLGAVQDMHWRVWDEAPGTMGSLLLQDSLGLQGAS